MPRFHVPVRQPFYAVTGGVLLLGFLVFTSYMRVQAQEQQEPDAIVTSISPVVFELTANPGDNLSNTIKVTNLSKQDLTYAIEVSSFTGNELGQAKVEEGDPAYALQNWITVSPKNFTLAPRTQQLISLTIKIPKDAEPGGRYATVLARTGGDNSELSGTGATVGQKVGTLVLLSVSGTTNYRATVESFTPSKTLYERVNKDAPLVFNARIHNESTVHIKPVGFVSLASFSGKKVTDIEVLPKNVLPNSNRLLEVQTGMPLRIGRYTATLALNYGDQGDQLLSTTSFWVFPWKVGLPVTIGTILLFGILITRRKRIVHALRILFGK